MPENNTPVGSVAPSVKKYVDYAQTQIDEQAILDKYNAATMAQYNVQREQNRQAENQFYNQMYNTQRTAMDTIRQSNAAAVSSGASRGVQAANELSALLGLQEESVASATELAQANRQTAQEETAAVLENVLNAYQQAAQERSQLVSQGIEAASVDAQESANQIAAMEAQTNRINAETQQEANRQNEAQTLNQAATNGVSFYLDALATLNKDYKEYSEEGAVRYTQAINSLFNGQEGKDSYPTKDDFGTPGFSSEGAIQKTAELKNNIQRICTEFGLNYDDFTFELDWMENIAKAKGSDSNINDAAIAATTLAPFTPLALGGALGAVPAKEGKYNVGDYGYYHAGDTKANKAARWSEAYAGLMQKLRTAYANKNPANQSK